MGLDSKRASLIGTIGAHRVHALHDSKELTKNGRAASQSALNERLLDEIDPARELPDEERAKRLKHARSAHFRQLSLKRRRR